MSEHSKDNSDPTTHFGYQQVPTDEKQQRVGQVFSSVAKSYDVMNDLMSMGIHRLWKRFAIELTGLRPGQKVLDLAGGTGDLSIKMSKLVGPQGTVILSDINEAMLGVGRDRLTDLGLAQNIDYVQINAEELPFPNNYFDCITIGFGLRNVTDKDKALRAMTAALKPGGRLLILEFSKPKSPLLAKLYDAYSFNVLPKIGQVVAKDADSYQYLAESIRMHPDQATLQGMMEQAGLTHCEYHNMTGGIVAVHRGYKA